MYAKIYESAWQHPGVAFILGGAALLFVLSRAPWRRSDGRAWAILLLLLELEILLDAALTGALSPLSGRSASAAIATFVVLGDLRYFYLVERQRRDSRWRALFIALMLTLPLSALCGLGHLLWPQYLTGSPVFLIYELGLIALLVGHFTLRRSSWRYTLHGGAASYARRLLVFEILQYGLWALADLVILLGSDLGWGLRMVPNFLYYVAFVPCAVLYVPDEARA